MVSVPLMFSLDIFLFSDELIEEGQVILMTFLMQILSNCIFYFYSDL